MPTRKYINKEKKKPKSSEDDEWAHIIGVEEGPKVRVSDAMDVEDRSIFIRDSKRKPTSTVDMIQDELEETGHRTRTTDQYVKLVNAILDERLLEIEKMKKRSESFDDDLENLSSGNKFSFENFEKIPIHEMKSKDVAKLIKVLNEEKGSTLSKLEHFKTQAYSLEKELLEKDKKINELDKHLKEKMVKENKEEENSQEEKPPDFEDKLKLLEELYGKEKLVEALKKLEKSGDI